MEIRQFRVALRARNFERTCRFYGEVLGFPRAASWERDGTQGALFRAGHALVEIIGRTAAQEDLRRDERYDYQGPEQKMTLTLIVPSAQGAYEELQFREKNIPGGLRSEPDGWLIFETHDPDGVRIAYRERE